MIEIGERSMTAIAIGHSAKNILRKLNKGTFTLYPGQILAEQLNGIVFAPEDR